MYIQSNTMSCVVKDLEIILCLREIIAPKWLGDYYEMSFLKV
jgi:hypothetical protein